MKVIALVGMAGSGKSTVADMLTGKGYGFVRFGQITLDIVRERGLMPTEENERPIREEIRRKNGMAAYAILNFPKIDSLLSKGPVVVDGLYSWEEYLEMKKRYGRDFAVVAVYASPATRYARLAARAWNRDTDEKMRNRAHTPEQAKARDHAQIENLHTGGPIAMADYTLVNEGSVEELREGFGQAFLWMQTLSGSQPSS